MGYFRQDNIKLRLTEREQLTTAVQKLMAAGISEDLIPAHLVQAFYVDMDELNHILDTVAKAERDAALLDLPLMQHQA